MSNFNQDDEFSELAAAFAGDLACRVLRFFGDSGQGGAPPPPPSLDENWINRFNEFCSRHAEALEYWQDEEDGDSLFYYHYFYLVNACIGGCQLETFQGLVTRRVLAFQDDGNNGWTLLHWICSRNPSAADSVSLFLRLCPEAAKAVTNHTRNTPLHFACSNRNASLKVIKLLVEAHPDAVHTANITGRTPLHNACFCPYASLGIIRFLVLQAPFASLLGNNDGELPLELAKKQRRNKQESDKVPIVQFMTMVTKAAAGAVTSHVYDLLPGIYKHNNVAFFIDDEVGLFKMMFSHEQVQLFLQNKAGVKESIQQAVIANAVIGHAAIKK